MAWKDRSVLVTGGTSFIGSQLVDVLVGLGARVRVADDLSSGLLVNIQAHLDNGIVELIQGDLRDTKTTQQALAGINTVFHLAADHGGRGYVDTFQAGPASNLFLDGLIFWEALQAGVEKVVFASSGCVYPNNLQADANEELYLTEDLVVPPYDADNMYGWAKLMGELTLQAYHREYGLKAASCRYFTVYGPRAKENHAVMAMIARAFLRRDPYEVWGDGTQVRNWTHVDDIVSGTILAAENIDDGTAINLGTMERITVAGAARMVLEMTEHPAEIKYLTDMPTGPINRVADNAVAKDLLGWEPTVMFRDGLKHTIDWYYKNKTREEVTAVLDGGGFIARQLPKKVLS
ncbi:MAG: GDP-L-fucose synthase 1 [SAR202 cluster bacterium Io17-Chloro-G9]|nr:MAG: GDP-L-fucose synthase 1 [SAR202 cluster bacterium Io17-Chloro-G9]